MLCVLFCMCNILCVVVVCAMCVVVVCAVRAAAGGKDPELSRFVIRCLVSGVAHMHSKGALHGDLKPLNASPALLLLLLWLFLILSLLQFVN